METMKPITRRTLLRRTLWGAASTLALPYFIPASARGRDGYTAPSERMTLGLIGLGLQMTYGHFGALVSRRDVQILAVCDVRRNRRDEVKGQVEKHYAQEKAAGTYHGCEAYNEYERIVERPDIDLCFITTPDHWHVPIALAAIRQGKDCYVEKPLTLTVREGRLLSDAARRYGRVVQTGTQQRSDGAFRRASEIVRNGWIGKVHTVYAALGKFPPPRALPEQPIPEGFDYDRWLGPTPWQPYHAERVLGNYGGGWRCFWEYGARKNGDWGAHHYDIIQWALGHQYRGPTTFFPKGERGEYQGFEYPGGPVVLRDHPIENGHMIHFIGEKGTVSVSREGQMQTTPASLRNRPLQPSDAHLPVSNDHHQNFFDCVRTRARPIADVEIGHRSATVCHLSAISERLNRTIRWNPDTEEIVGDAEASKWLDRPRRAPYVL